MPSVNIASVPKHNSIRESFPAVPAPAVPAPAVPAPAVPAPAILAEPTPVSPDPIAKSALFHRTSRLSAPILYLAFAATGVCMALPGAVLPALLSAWHLDDGQAGTLFFVSWMGTAIGAFSTRAPISRSLAWGSLSLAAACLGIAFAPVFSHLAAVSALPSPVTSHWLRFLCLGFFGLFGIGLGIAMTAISLLRSTRRADNRSLELSRLNLTWSIGACLAPSLAEHSLRVVDVRSIFATVAAFFTLFFLWVALFERSPKPSPATSLARSSLNSPSRLFQSPLALWPLAIVAIIGLPTGIESSLGAWTTAYVQRSHQTLATTVTADTCFWTGLMLSRVLSSFLLRRRRWERFITTQSLITVVLGLLLLIATHSTPGIFLGILLIGFGLGPIYPLMLAIALQYSENATIFFIAGLGSSSLPWITGALSSHTSSLRIGLVVPLIASILMLILGLKVSQLEVPRPLTPSQS